MTTVVLLRMADRTALAAAVDAAWERDLAVWVVDHGASSARMGAMMDGIVAHRDVRRLAGRDRVEVDLPVPADTATIVTSSGTTGRPKVVCLSRGALDASARGAHAHMGLGAEDRWGLALPLHHVAGLSVLWRARVLGRPAAVQDGLDPSAMDAAGVTAISLVTTQLRRLIDAGQTLRARVLLGGGAIAPRLLADAATHVGGITRSYGLTETAGGCVYDGVPFEGTEVAVRDGRLGLRGPTLAAGIMTPKGLQDIVDRAGWLWTNDIGAVDERGVVSVVGRADDVVITGGVKVDPTGVEAVLADHPAVAEAGVVGVPDDQWGHRVVAAVVLAESTSDDAGSPAPTSRVPGDSTIPFDLLADLQARVRDALGGPATPRRIVVVDTLPLTSLGKLARRELAARFTIT